MAEQLEINQIGRYFGKVYNDEKRLKQLYTDIDNKLIQYNPQGRNFDITANWTKVGITDEQSFIIFLQSGSFGGKSPNSFTTIKIKYFLLEEDPETGLSRIRCGLIANSRNGYYNLVAGARGEKDAFIITEVIGIGNVTGVNLLDLTNNQITSFDPSIALPSSLQALNLSNNQITSFDPSIPLPGGLETLNIESNQITSFDPSIALPSSLQALNLSNNQITSFNPSELFPNSIILIDLSNNFMTSEGYSTSIPWANSLEVAQENSKEIYLGGNYDSAVDTDFAAVLNGKGFSITF